MINYGGRICLTGREVWAVLGSNFNTLLSRGLVRNILGNRKRTLLTQDDGNDILTGLYDVDLFPNRRTKYRDRLYEAYPDIAREKALMEAKRDNEEGSYFFSLMEPDPKAREFFMQWRDRNGVALTDGERLRYENSAMVLNAMRQRWEKSYSRHAATGTVSKMRIGEYFQSMAKLMPRIVERFELSFNRMNWRRLGEMYNEYVQSGYESLISGKKGNQNARVVDTKVEQMFVSMYCRANKPYAKWVSEDVTAWLNNRKVAADKTTGEVIEAKAKRRSVSAQTVLNYLNQPHTRAMLEQRRLSYYKYGQDIRPHVVRRAPVYSLSKISLDDRDLPRKEKSGNRVKAYYAYDVATGAIVGAAYSMAKNEDLFLDCLRDMFRNLERWGVGIPMEVEVENHLTRRFEDHLLRAGEMFPFVRWCAPTNSQEKAAETWNRSKKYGAEKRMGQAEIGRWYSKNNTNNAVQGERYYNEKTDRYEIRSKAYEFEELVADDRAANEAHNATVWDTLSVKRLDRPETFLGKSRFEALCENVNPSVTTIDRTHLAKYIGIRVRPSNQDKGLILKRNQYVNALYGKYWLPSSDVLKRLESGNYELDCYYFADDETQMYMYQNGRYICTANRMVKPVNSQAEWTETDETALTAQMKYITHFDKSMKDAAKANIKDLYIEDVDVLDSIIEKEEARPPSEPIYIEQEEQAEPDYAFSLADYEAFALNSI